MSSKQPLEEHQKRLKNLIHLTGDRRNKSLKLKDAIIFTLDIVCGHLEQLENTNKLYSSSKDYRFFIIKSYENSLEEFRKSISALDNLISYYLSRTDLEYIAAETLSEPKKKQETLLNSELEEEQKAELESYRNQIKLFDRSVAKSIWDGKIPVIFNLHQGDLENSMNQPELVYLMVNRCSYFHIITKDIVQDFQKYVKKNEQDSTWFEYKDVPLKTNLPVGVLFDLYGSISPLPWRITIHFKNFPNNVLSHVKPEENEHMFFSTMKQSETIKTGGIKRIMSLSKINQIQLWESLVSRNFDKFWEINSNFTQGENGQSIKAIPFKIYLPNSLICMKNIPPTNKEGKEETLGGLLKTCLPELFTDDKQPTVLIHGISPPLSTPALWLSTNLCYQDNILHIVVHP